MTSLVDLEEPAMMEENLRAWVRKASLEARQEGEIHGMRKTLLQVMTLRFGRLPLRVRRQLEEISSAQELSRLTQRVLAAASLEDMDLH
jgi:hypothetical protein